MKRKLIGCFFVVAVILFTSISCKKQGGVDQIVYDPTTTTGTLKETASFPVGVGIGFTPMTTNTTYANIVKTEFDNVTFEYHMKHGAIVRNDGTKNYTNTDALVNAASGAGLQIYGHVLAWHQNNNGDFLRSFGVAPPANATNFYAGFNGDFEGGTGNTFPNWSRLAGDGGVAAYDVETNSPPQGTRAFKVAVTTLGANPWSIQTLGSTWTAVSGKQYQIKLWAKGPGTVRLVNQNAAYAQTDITTTGSWAEYTWNYTAGETAPQFKLQFPQLGTYWVDDIRILETAPAPPSSAAVAAKVDSVLKDWVQGMVNRYKDKVHAWDAVNEPFTDGSPVLRTGTSTGDTYYWAQFLGRDYIKKTFTYANQADPTAELFLNDYNLESNPAKLDSIIALAKQLKDAGVPITGIGTQMHISVFTSMAGIANMFQKLAATGLKIKVTELDVRINPNDAAGFTATKQYLDMQAVYYQFVVDEYVKNIPAAQRYGITMWNVGDTDSWIVAQNKVDFPTLFDKDYKKKPAYAGLMTGLKAGK
jgi:endo-1,4-beta-xylanase